MPSLTPTRHSPRPRRVFFALLATSAVAAIVYLALLPADGSAGPTRTESGAIPGPGTSKREDSAPAPTRRRVSSDGNRNASEPDARAVASRNPLKRLAWERGFTVRCVSSTGDPVSEAEITVAETRPSDMYWGLPSPLARTDANGVARFDSPFVFAIRITASKVDVGSATSDWLVRGDDQTLPLRTGASLEIVVRGSEQQQVDASVSVFPVPQSSEVPPIVAHSDSEGVIHVLGLAPGSYDARLTDVEHNHRNYLVRIKDLLPNEHRKIDVALRPRPSLAVRIVDERGLSPARVTIRDVRNPARKPVTSRRRDDGLFELRKPDGGAVLSVSDGEGRSAVTFFANSKFYPQRSLNGVPKLVLRKTCSVLVRGDGIPADKRPARVILDVLHEPRDGRFIVERRAGVLGDQGECRFSGIPSDTPFIVRTSVRQRGLPVLVQQTTGEPGSRQVVDVEFGDDIQFRLRVTDTAGAPLAGVGVLVSAAAPMNLGGSLHTPRSFGCHSFVRTGSDGTASMAGPRNSVVSLELVKSGFLPITRTVELLAHMQEHTLALRRLVPVEVKLVTTEHTPITGAFVEVFLLGGEKMSPICITRSDSRGHLKFRVPDDSNMVSLKVHRDGKKQMLTANVERHRIREVEVR